MSSIALISAPSFTVESIPLTSLSNKLAKTVRKTARIWEKIAKLKGQYESDAQAVFADAEAIAQCLIQDVKPLKMASISFFKQTESSNLVLCKDSSGNIQAIAMVDILCHQMEIKRLMTHPNNIRSSLSEGVLNRVSGAGSAIIHHLRGKMDKSSRISEISLSALASSVDFYTKIGFTLLETVHSYDSEEDSDDERVVKRYSYSNMVLLREK